MEETTVPSLKWCAYVAVAVHLWKQDDAVNAVSMYRHPQTEYDVGECKSSWRTVEDVVIKKLQSLKLPETVEQEALMFVNAIGWEIAMWLWHIRQITGRDTWRPDDIKNLSFTSEGCIHRGLCVDAIVKDTYFNIRERYTLACVYCLRCHIIALSGEASDIRFQEVKLPIIFFCSFWDKAVRDRANSTRKDKVQNNEFYENKRRIVYSNMLKCAIANGFKDTCHFFCKIAFKDGMEKYMFLKDSISMVDGSSCVKTCVKEDYCNAVLYCFHEMDGTYQGLIMKEMPHLIEEYYLNWPRQRLFLNLLKCIGKYRNPRHFVYTLNNILDKILNGYKDFDYKELFKQYWNQGWIYCKVIFIYDETEGRVLDKLLQVMDTEVIDLVLRSIPSQERRKVFAIPAGKSTLRKLEDEGKVEILALITNLCAETRTTQT